MFDYGQKGAIIDCKAKAEDITSNMKMIMEKVNWGENWTKSLIQYDNTGDSEKWDLQWSRR